MRKECFFVFLLTQTLRIPGDSCGVVNPAAVKQPTEGIHAWTNTEQHLSRPPEKLPTAIPTDGPKLPPMTDKQTRWVLEPKESKKLYVKFFSTKTGQQDQVLQFEIVGSYKNFNLNAKASCDFPMIS